MPNRPRTQRRATLETIFNDNYHRKINSAYGIDSAGRKNSHRGVDYGANSGEPLFPAAKDTPVEITKAEAGVNKNYWGNKPNNIKDWGNYVIYYMPEYDTSLSYAHMDKVNVKTGDKVGYKQLGTVGNTGYSSGPHLDLMIAKGKITTLTEMRDKAVDPEKYVLKKIEKPSEEFKVGSSVVLNGRVHYNSAGAKPGATFKDRKGKITIIEKGAKFPYHIDNLGWVAPDAIGAAKPESKPTPKPQPKPQPQPVKNEYGQNVKVGDIIDFSILYTSVNGGTKFVATDTGSNQKISRKYIATRKVNGKNVQVYRAKVGKIYPKSSGYPNAYEVLTDNGAILGRVNPINTY